jgi:N-methylhydantoinase A
VEKAPWEKVSRGGAAAPTAERMAYCPQRREMVRTPVYSGPGLPAETRLEGPAIIEHPGTTIVIHTGQAARIDAFRHTHIATGVTGKGGRGE